LKLLLAIDTSAGTSAAVLDGERLLSYSFFEDPFGHAENIGMAISKALTEAGVSAGQITAVAIGRGPAPYTGLRVGMAAGLGFATARGIQALGVITLDALALANPIGKILVTFDAKRKELFARTYIDGVASSEAWVMNPTELENFQDHLRITQSCNAELVGRYAVFASQNGIDLTDVSALYLRSPDVSPSAPKKVSG
jgi:tRNA threonylcarbamoyladenosine biosynthesis protein TsaB